MVGLVILTGPRRFRCRIRCYRLTGFLRLGNPTIPRLVPFTNSLIPEL
jgi:hypothetical protein